MTRYPAGGAWLPRALRALRAILPAAALSAAAALSTLSGCAGAPERAEGALSPEDIAAAFAEARGQLIIATPAALELCAALMGQQGLRRPQVAEVAADAAEVAALAGSMYRLLYPDREAPSVFPPAGAYEGPYRQALANARRGAPPPPEWAPGQDPGGEASADGAAASEAALARFLDRVVPALHLAHAQPESAGAGSGQPALRALRAGLEAARDEFPGSVLPPYLLGRLSELSGLAGAAVPLYQECLVLSGSFYPARRRLAELYLADGRAGDAAAQLESLRAEFPQDPAVRDSLIGAYLASPAPEKASALVAEALMESPDSREHLYLRGEILLGEGNWSQALKPLALLLLNHPEAREGYLLTARIQYEHARDIERALEVIAEAEARFPADPELPELAASMLLAEGRSDEGLERLRHTLELDPGRLSSLRLVAAEAVRLGRWIQASRSLEEILARQESVEDLLRAFTVAERLGDRARALGHAEKLNRLEGGDRARLRYAGALLAAGRAEQARGLIEQGVGPAAEPEVRSSLLFLQARLLEESDPEEALRTLQRALIADPDNEAAVRRLAELYLLRGQLREARLFFRTAVQHDPGDAGLKLQLEQVEQALEKSGGQPAAD